MTAPTVVVLDQVAQHADAIRDALDEHGLADLQPVVAEEREDSLAAIEDAEIALSFAMTAEQLAAADRLEWVQALSAGVDDFPRDALAERGITLTNASGVHAEPIGEQVLGYLLVFERRIHEGMRQQRAGEWEPYTAGEVCDQTLGIVGVGAIGERVAEFGSMLGMDVVGTKRDTSEVPPSVDDLYGPDGLDAVLDRADYLVLACPLTDETRGLIGADELDRLDDEAVLVNVARGAVVDEDALLDALDRDAIRGAALDVFEEEPLPGDAPIRDRDDVVATPHMAGTTPHYFDRAIGIFADNYREYAGGGDPEFHNRVSYR